MLLTKWSMALAYDILHGHGPSNKMHPSYNQQRLRQKALLAVNIAAKGIIRAVHC